MGASKMEHIALSLKDIYFNRKTGQLGVRGPGFLKNLYFQDGNLIFVKTNVVAERLGGVLFRMKKIDEDVYKAIPGLIRPDMMIGETLVRKGLISQKDLYEGIVAQMTSVVLSLFGCFDAKISFQARSRFSEDSIEHDLIIPRLIEQGIRAMPFHPSLTELFADKIPLAAGDDEFSLLTKDERSLLTLLNGKRPAEYVKDIQTGSEHAFWKTLFLFYCLDLIELHEASFALATNEEANKEAEVNARLREALELRKKLAQMEDFEILGVAPDAPNEEIKKAYFKAARKFHPDLFGRQLEPEYKALIDEVFDAITKAYRTLTRDKVKLSAASPPPKPASPSRAEEKEKAASPETLYRQGKTLFNQGRYEEAIGLLDEVARQKDDKADYFLLLALAQSRVPSLSKKAEKNFQRAIELESWNPEGLVGLGLLYKREGLMSRAKKQFERALEVDAEHKIARQELEALKEKSDSKKGWAGFLNKGLFGPKKK
jgi:tetratricopeptide (TPR) repeat protein